MSIVRVCFLFLLFFFVASDADRTKKEIEEAMSKYSNDKGTIVC